MNSALRHPLIVAATSAGVLLAAGCGSTTAGPSRAVASGGDAEMPAGLRAAPRRIVSECRSLSAKVTIRVWCPSLVPVTSIIYQRGVSGPMFYGRRRDIYEVSANNGLANRHWMIGAGRPAAVRSVVIDGKDSEVPGRGTRGEPERLDGARVDIYRFVQGVGGPHRGHILAMRCNPSECVYSSVHGTGRLKVVLALLKGLRPAAQ